MRNMLSMNRVFTKMFKAFKKRTANSSAQSEKANSSLINIYVKELDATWIGLAYTEQKIVATALSHSKESALKSLLGCLAPKADYQISERPTAFAEKIIQASRDVHSGGPPFTDFALATEYIPEPLATVLKAAASIPIGYVASYGGIAKTAKTEPRTVGKIMASNPLYPIVQCHRVVGTDYSLIGYGGRKNARALKAKLTRLEAERKGYKSKKEITVNGTTLSVYPVEYVVDKAKKQGLSPRDRQQRTITSY
jgi:O-6-methylguanine DNA methyltransferase